MIISSLHAIFLFESLGGKMNMTVELVVSVGKRIKVKKTSRQPKIPQGQKLVAVVHNGSKTVAEDVTEFAKYIGYHTKYCCGIWHSMDLYLLTEHQILKCYVPDHAGN